MKTPKNDIEKRALELFERTLKRPNAERISFVETEADKDESLKQRVLTLLMLDAQSGSKILTGQAVFDGTEEDLSNAEIGSYRILELIGKGGMGAVYKAERKAGDFTHNVAIKVIRPGVLSEPLVERFERERQTLANFLHPNIARLYDGGTTEDDAPYIIMEYVNGTAITDFAEMKNLNITDRLKLFKNACEAIAYAHQNLIIHRDITPNNILVTQEGEVKLIDFGIAKALDENLVPEPSDNSLGSLSFTPGFAAPERSKGAAANTLSDIYSLGKLLEALLLQDTASHEIEAIIAKAAHINPQVRYTSVDALIDDVSNYNNNFPVVAINSTSRYKVSKFIKRHSLGVATSTLAVLGLITAFGVTTYQYQRAETARFEADKRFNDVRTLARTMMFDIYDKISQIPGGTDAEFELASAAQIYLEDLALGSHNNRDLAIEAARGFHRLAHIRGNPSSGALKQFDEAKANLKASEQLLLPILLSNPDDTESRLELSKIYYAMTDLALFGEHNMEVAESYVEKSIETLEKGRSVDFDSIPLRKALIASLSMKSLVLARNAKHDEALAIALDVKKANMELAQANPNDADIRRQVAIGLNNLGRQFKNMEAYQEAIDVYSQALLIAQKLREEDSQNELYQRDVAYTLWRRALGYSNLGNGTASLEDFNKAVDEMKKLVDWDPKNSNNLSFYYAIKGERMLAYKHLGDYEAAEAEGIEYLKNSESFLLDHPSDKNTVRDIMIGYWNLVGLYNTWNKKNKMCRTLSELYIHVETMKPQGTFSERDREKLAKDFDVTKIECGLD